MLITEESISYIISQEQICSNEFQNVMVHKWVIASSACSTKIAAKMKADNYVYKMSHHSNLKFGGLCLALKYIY